MPNVPDPTFENTILTEEEKLEALNKQKVYRAKHERKPRDKTSHIYFYIRKRLLSSCFFPKVKGGPSILQEYRQTCNVYYREPNKHNKKFEVLKSYRKGVTIGMADHLKTHRIIKDTHNVRKAGYIKAPYNNPDTTQSSTKDLLTARLTPRQVMRHWFVKSRQAFLEVEQPEFQEVFYSLRVASPYRSRLTLRNGIYDDFLYCRLGLV